MKSFLFFSLASQVAAIWPAPQSYTHGSSAVWIDEGIVVTYNGRSVRWSPHYAGSFSDFWEAHTNPFKQLHLGPEGKDTPSGTFNSYDIVTAAVQRAYHTIFAEEFIPWKLHPRNKIENFEPSCDGKKTVLRRLTITQTSKDDSSTFKPLAGQVDESYTLSVGIDGSASITAVSSTGILYALQTFTQLFYLHSSGSGIYSNLAPVKITDSPRFAHRGLNMDVARNWYPKNDILRTIDAIAYNKLNRLHLHMTDSQSWPLDIPALPELSRNGAYQTGLTYSAQDFSDMQAYAVYRGVEVVVEFDMPGHTTSIGLSHPELITAFDAQPWDKYCAEPPCGSLKLNSTAVPKFLKTLFDDVLPRIKPYSSYFHSGGDEVNVNAYLLDDTVKSNLTSVLTPLMQKFVDRNHDQIRAAGLAPIVWEEMALDWNLTLGKDVVVQTWISEESVAKVTEMGHKVLFGNYNFWVRSIAHLNYV
jgi:hexosaminidase